jgi:drug/metabolite transporter (DMT)-like permease
MKKAYILLHCAILLLGFSPVFGKLISLNEGLLTFYRVFFTTILLFFVLKIYKVNTKISIKEKLNIGKIGLLLAFSWLFFFAGIKYSNISIGVICYCTASFFTAILNPILTKSKFKFSELLLSSFIVIGVLCMFNVDASYGLGITLGLISPILYTIYSIYNKKLTTSYDSKLINYYQMLMSSVVLGSLLPIYLYYNPVKSIFPDFNNTIYLICLALFCTVLVYLFLTESLKKVSAFTANLTMNLEPVYAVIIAFVFFDEGKSMNVWFYVGIFIIVISIILQFYLMKREN